MARDLIGEVGNDLEAKIVALPEFKQKDVTFYTPDDFTDESKEMKLPACAVIFTAATPITGRKPLSAMIRFGIFIIGSQDRKGANVDSGLLLSKKVFDAIKQTTAPTGHGYEFDGLFPFDVGTGLGYVQYWQVPGQFTN